MKRDLVLTQPITSSFLSCEKDTELILRKLFIESRPYSDILKRLLVLPVKDCISNFENIEYKFALADVYFKKNNKIEYEYLLRDIVNDKDATLEQLESAYGKLIAIYTAREDYRTVNELILASNNESIKMIEPFIQI